MDYEGTNGVNYLRFLFSPILSVNCFSVVLKGDADADAVLMQYNDPFQPPWKRRNEVAIPVVPRN